MDTVASSTYKAFQDTGTVALHIELPSFSIHFPLDVLWFGYLYNGLGLESQKCLNEAYIDMSNHILQIKNVEQSTDKSPPGHLPSRKKWHYRTKAPNRTRREDTCPQNKNYIEHSYSTSLKNVCSLKFFFMRI